MHLSETGVKDSAISDPRWESRSRLKWEMGSGKMNSLICTQPGQDWSNSTLNYRVGSQRLLSTKCDDEEQMSPDLCKGVLIFALWKNPSCWRTWCFVNNRIQNSLVQLLFYFEVLPEGLQACSFSSMDLIICVSLTLYFRNKNVISLCLSYQNTLHCPFPSCLAQCWVQLPAAL